MSDPQGKLMSGPVWRNVYSLTDDQISKLDMAEDNMEMMKLGLAERILIDIKIFYGIYLKIYQ